VIGAYELQNGKTKRRRQRSDKGKQGETKHNNEKTIVEQSENNGNTNC
jgi:hypothetical protein